MLKVIYGHNVEENAGYHLNKYISISTSIFENFIRSKKKEFNFVSEINKNFIDKGKNILLTFDDGYRNFYTIVLPILEKYKIPCILYVTTGFIGNKMHPYEILLEKVFNTLDLIHFPDCNANVPIKSLAQKKRIYNEVRTPLKFKRTEEREKYIISLLKKNGLTKEIFLKDEFLSWDEVKKIDKNSLVTIGAHTHTHPVLTKISMREAYKEIKESKKILEEKLDHTIQLFSYPYGANSFLIRQLVNIVGFQYAFTTEEKEISKRNKPINMAIPRFDINSIIRQGN